MGNFAAVLVLIACQAGSDTCLKQPVRVISYESSLVCRAQRDDEMRKATRPGFEIYGECNSFNGDLLSGKPRIDIKRDVAKLSAETTNDRATETVNRRAFY
ncbi:hypothetical protein H4S14_000234 [Agrobacterium vitis]|nr:hypothetical protein [Agrobacterium vitis]MBE1436507.1 hypothetical protein [Agrobacterium vitis]